MTQRLSGKSPESRPKIAKSGKSLEKVWKKFPEYPLSHAPKLQNLENVWKKFPGYPLSHRPFFGNSFRDLPIRVKETKV